jgi:hypothetical protein
VIICLPTFVVAMEILSCLMKDCVEGSSGVGFHHKFLKIKLTHLCFADDILTFSEATERSVVAVKNILLEFESLGLKANSEKSSLFCSSVSRVMQEKISACLQMK